MQNLSIVRAYVTSHRHTHTHMQMQSVVSPEGTQLSLETKVSGVNAHVCVCVCVYAVFAVSSSFFFYVHPPRWQIPVNIEVCLHPPSPTDTFLWALLFFCAAMHPGKEAVMPDGDVVSLMLGATVQDGHFGPHSLWQQFTQGENNSLLDRKYSMLLMHLYPNDWWHNLCKELENTYF